EPAGELARVRRLSRTLKARHQHDRRWSRRVRDAHRLAAEGLDQLLVDDLDDLLRGVQRLVQLEPDRPFADARLEAADDPEVDVGLEEREPDLVQDFVDVLLAKAAAATQPLEDPVESVRECLEHAGSEVNGSGSAPGFRLHARTPQFWPFDPVTV